MKALTHNKLGLATSQICLSLIYAYITFSLVLAFLRETKFGSQRSFVPQNLHYLLQMPSWREKKKALAIIITLPCNSGENDNLKGFSMSSKSLPGFFFCGCNIKSSPMLNIFLHPK